MEQEIVPAFGVTALHKWLEQKLRESDMSQKRLALRLDIDSSQMNRIIRGKEAISDRTLRHACRIFGLSDAETSFILECSQVYDAQKSFNKMNEAMCKRYPDEDLHGLISNIQVLLFRIADSLYARSYLLGPERSLKRLTGFLFDAEILTRDLIRAYLHQEPLISPENTAFHLRQPLSAFVGGLMNESRLGNSHQTDEIKAIILSEFRCLAKQKYQSGSETDYLQQHAVHMLSRYGKMRDREFTLRYLKSEDILARRMALFGMALGGDPDVNLLLLRLVHDDPYFLQAVASFDAVHYGDATLIEGRLPKSAPQLGITISNSLGYILRDVKEENVDLNFIKITAFVRSFGTEVIDATHKPAITRVLRLMSTPDKLSAPRREFQESFQSIV